ncbi:tRNA glutamyl-Q(34) synthetase GluQRS [Sphingomonas antarctica]|uniref:tRNA glutamyl-Q(34) synthetase GluQRS n=1 Tax=Sphingomonas antarctica TaxID=2040274 RepID=UPI0039EAEF79
MTAFSPFDGQAVSRFAPSPTGLLHLGHAYSAVLARGAASRFLLRIEDIDGGRCRPEFVTAIFDDLHWLGVDWDGPPVIQSEQAAAHDAALAKLRDMGLVYRCICTRADIAAAAGAPQGEQPPLYPGTCRGRSFDFAQPFAWRLDMAQAIARVGPLHWHDTLVGDIRATPEIFGDVVAARKDAGTSYHLAATVDDAAMGITKIVRGQDLLTATHVHRLLQALLDLPTPIYHHHRLILGADGKRLAKRTSGATLADLRASGVDGRALAADLRAGGLPHGFSFDPKP